MKVTWQDHRFAMRARYHRFLLLFCWRHVQLGCGHVEAFAEDEGLHPIWVCELHEKVYY